MSEKRFTMKYSFEDDEYVFYDDGIPLTPSQTVNKLNEQQELIEELHNKKMYIKRLEYKVQKFKEMNGEQQSTINNFEKLFSETIGVADTSKLLETGKYEIKRMVVKELIENLQKENEQLKQIIKDIVCATDETYTKNTSMFKVTVVFDGKMYNQIRSCLYE